MVKKLDRKFQGTITKVKDGSTVPDDQYIVFLAKDNAFAAILPSYISECVRLGCDPEQISSARRLLADVIQWREDHPELCKNPDARGEALL